MDAKTSLKGRSFLTLKDFTPEEIGYFLDLAAKLNEAFTKFKVIAEGCDVTKKMAPKVDKKGHRSYANKKAKNKAGKEGFVG